jgi:hypothetical protein
MWRRPGACTLIALLSYVNCGKRSRASFPSRPFVATQHHGGVLARALPPVLKGCGVVQRQPGGGRRHDRGPISHLSPRCDNHAKFVEECRQAVCHREELCPTLHSHTCKPTITAGIRRVGTVLLLCCSHHQTWTKVGSQSQRPSVTTIDFIWVWLAGEGERRDLNPRPLEPQSSALPAELRPPQICRRL